MDVEGSLDPRIQIELENLNTATDNINKLETELDEAHTAFRQLLSDTTRRLKEIADKLGHSCIEKARCYYEALEMARQAQVECQQQAQLFQRASEIHAAAKETVALAETRFMSHQHEWNFDQAWQDMLNHATIKVMDAENQKAECGREHHKRTTLFHDAEKKLLQLEEKHHRSIIKARPYFEVKTQCDQMLATQKERVEHLQQAVKDAKRNYATSLRTLEEISNQIHQQRRDYDIVVNGPREPGVGAELIVSGTCQNRENNFNGSDSHKISSVRYESENNEKLHNIEESSSSKENAEHLDKRSVDGSESKFTQWELEMQASVEKINRLSVEDLFYVKKQDNTRNSSDLRDPVPITNNSCYNTLPGQSDAHSLNQSLKLAKDLENFEKDLYSHKLPHMQRSCSTLDSFTILNSKSNVTSKRNFSKSLTNSPVNRSIFNFENRRITNKAENENILGYIPNRISQFDIKDRKSQSNWNIHYSPDSETDVTNEEQHRYNTNDSLVGNSQVQTTNLSYMEAPYNIVFVPTESNLSEEYNSANYASGSQQSLVLQTLSNPNVLQKVKSRSTHSSPLKINHLLKSSTKPSHSEVTEHLDECSVVKKFIKKTSSIKELPLLSLFGRTAALSTIKGKSCSMIDLNSKQNLQILLDNSYLNNIHALSVEKLANVRHKLVNDHSEFERDNTKK